MSLTHRIMSALFTALPSALYFTLVVTSRGMRGEYYWQPIFVAVSVLLGTSLLFGFMLPPKLGPKWLWILAAGMAAILLALFVLTVLNATPLCVGQDNGDGNNDFGQCMGYVILYAFFYGIPHMMMLTLSAIIGHWVFKGLSRF